MLMVVFAEGLFISCALSEIAPVAITGIVLAVWLPILLVVATILIYDLLLPNHLMKRHERSA